ncbi:MAG: potassium transporter TrkA [Deltaproteobacteria bacterium HGW-Deltaproteobacteria-15]|jgi:trk system potassium uptake protein TrkA|nr:MAG: potassium transporter TrkA [Deltaproteobacteria bacterium HGW-Deltaproteobacteria-15]
MKNNLYIVIVGCGRVGSDLANRLSLEGHAVVVIDRDESAFGALSPDFSGFRIEGDASHLSVLKEAKLPQADVLIATTHEDNVNLMVAQVARKIFRVPQVSARVFDPRREQVYARLGIETVCPTSLAANVFLAAIHGELVIESPPPPAPPTGGGEVSGT